MFTFSELSCKDPSLGRVKQVVSKQDQDDNTVLANDCRAQFGRPSTGRGCRV